MKVCSFLPAVTQMIYDMGLDDKLYGITFECPKIALQEKEKVIRYKLEGTNYSSHEINQIFSSSKNSGDSLHYVDEEILKSISPDVILTQDVCEICQINTDSVIKALSKLELMPNVVSISPNSLEDVFSSAIQIAKVLGEEEVAHIYLNRLKERMDILINTQKKYQINSKRVSLLEWIDPIYNCGHWIPHQILFAGGVDMLSSPSGNSVAIKWEKIRKYDPEVLVIAPCGFNVKRSIKEFHLLNQKQGWEEIKAVQDNAVYFVDFDLFTQPSASTLVDGIEILAALFHPNYFEIPKQLRSKQLNMK